MVELQGGSIVIDGVNIRDIGLDALRGRLALVPQDRCVMYAMTAVLMLTHIKVYCSSARYERICESNRLRRSSSPPLLIVLNSDPQSTRTDAELISALQRAWLLPRDGTKDAAAEAKFGLEAAVGDEGRAVFCIAM
jgi:ATP-binding cassette subfamily C (CFTR/MRP) protein 1